MYEKRNIVYADAYKMLSGRGLVAYEAEGSSGDYTEVAADPADMRVMNGIARWGGGLIVMSVADVESYEQLKTRLIKLRYSNDDQIAVMLNGDESEMARMQSWRAWAADVAKRITESMGIK